MTRQSTLTVNLHRPQVQDATLYDSGTIVVGLGNDAQYHGSVNVFFEDVDALRAFIAALDDKLDELEAPGGKFVEALVTGVVAS